jgi:hypothetical protein
VNGFALALEGDHGKTGGCLPPSLSHGLIRTLRFRAARSTLPDLHSRQACLFSPHAYHMSNFSLPSKRAQVDPQKDGNYDRRHTIQQDASDYAMCRIQYLNKRSPPKHHRICHVPCLVPEENKILYSP